MFMAHPELHADTDGYSIELPFPPLVESWDRHDHPSQVRLRAYRDDLSALAAPALAVLEPPLALGFHVAGRPDIALGCDLDNFLTPVVKAFGGGERFSFVWAARGRPDEPASILFAPAATARVNLVNASRASVQLDVSPEREAWKVAIAAAVGTHSSSRNVGPIEIALRFTISPRRNWVTLWKPAIDALGGILGEGGRRWHPRDDRIALLVLQRELNDDFGWEIELDVWWTEPVVIRER